MGDLGYTPYTGKIIGPTNARGGGACEQPQGKDIIRRLCPGRNQEAAVIFVFGLGALFRRVSRVALSADLCLPTRWLLLAIATNKPVYNSLLPSVWALGKILIMEQRRMQENGQAWQYSVLPCLNIGHSWAKYGNRGWASYEHSHPLQSKPGRSKPRHIAQLARITWLEMWDTCPCLF